MTSPPPPDPGYEGTVFLQWLKKRGAMRKKYDCERKCRENGFTAKEFVHRMGKDQVRLARTRNGEEVVKLMDRVWADQWMIHHGLEVPHHRHWESMK